MTSVSELTSRFQKLFGGSPRIYRAPGRVNLIGEHTDYNEGYVMPAAVGLYVWVAISRRAGNTLRVHSTNYAETIEIPANAQPGTAQNRWTDYIQGIAVMLGQAGLAVGGADILIHGEVPVGAGLSSSAALGVATGFALLREFGLGADRLELAKLCQRAENEFVGARVGIMDPFASCYGEAGHALMLDCRSLEFRRLPLPDGVSLVICNTMVRHDLATGEYNTRRAECDEAVRILARALPQLRALRDISISQLEEHKGKLPDVLYRRSRHVVTENARVLAAAVALEGGDLERFGQLMGESHNSLRNDYEVSCAELDLMVDLARQQKGVYGARMMGGGFGGSTINLLQKHAVKDFKENIRGAYERATKLVPEIMACSAAKGVSEVGAENARNSES